MTATSETSYDDLPLIDQLRASRLPPPQERRAIRLAAGVTQHRMARELGVTQLTISYWERGVCEPNRSHRPAYRRLLDSLAALVHEANSTQK